MALQLPSGLNVADAVGWFLSGFFIFNSLILVCATLLPLAEFVVFALLEITFLCLFMGEFTGVQNWSKAGGYFGVFTAAAGGHCLRLAHHHTGTTGMQWLQG